jgi:hypothetical protein
MNKLFVNGFVIGALLIACPCAFYLGRYSAFNSSVQWQVIANQCTLQAEKLLSQVTALTKNPEEVKF